MGSPAGSAGPWNSLRRGNSPAGLIAGLAGGGEADLSDVEFARSDLAALNRVVARSQAPDAQLDETNIAYEFGRELSKAPLKILGSATPLLLSAGTAKFGPLLIGPPQGNATLNANFDLAGLSLETSLTLTSSPADLKFWSGPPPTATATVQNALFAAKRQVDVAALSAALATQAIARDTDRIANLEFGHSRTRLLQPTAQGRAVHRSTQRRNRGLARRAGAAERPRRATQGSAG